MAYQSLYRKYRSQSFGDLVGQDHVVRTLQSGISSGRIAHAYLFTGPRGTGKTSSARLIAKALCCENGPSPEPCNECDNCVAITEGSCLDVYEFDAASESGVDEIREVIVNVIDYKPAICRYKIFIIDEVHDLSGKAFDALLKTIEEPPEHIVFILATTEYNKVPPTIRSRCQKFEFHRASIADLVSRLKFVADSEEVEVELAALGAIAQMADGGFRDALTLLEQAILTRDGSITLQQVYDQLGLVPEATIDAVLEDIRTGNAAGLISALDELTRLGRDPRAILESMIHRLADLTRSSFGIDSGASADPTREAVAHDVAARIGREHLLELRTKVASAHRLIRDISLPRLWLEAELISWSQPRVVSHAPAAPRAKDPAPTPSVTVPKAVVADKVVAATEPTVQPQTSDPALQSASKAWGDTVAELSALSKLMAIKLATTRVVGAKDTEITVEFDRVHELDWIQESPKRVGAVNEAFAKHAGASVRLKLRAGRKVANNGDAPTVELPAEGQRLYEAAKQAFEQPEGE